MLPQGRVDPGGHSEAARRFGLLQRVERARGHGLTPAASPALLGLARSTLNKALQACLDYCSNRRPHPLTGDANARATGHPSGHGRRPFIYDWGYSCFEREEA